MLILPDFNLSFVSFLPELFNFLLDLKHMRPMRMDNVTLMLIQDIADIPVQIINDPCQLII